MAKVNQIEVSYEASRKPAGDYTSDKASVRWTILVEGDEKASELTEVAISKIKLIVLSKLNG